VDASSERARRTVAGSHRRPSLAPHADAGSRQRSVAPTSPFSGRPRRRRRAHPQGLRCGDRRTLRPRRSSAVEGSRSSVPGRPRAHGERRTRRRRPPRGERFHLARPPSRAIPSPECDRPRHGLGEVASVKWINRCALSLGRSLPGAMSPPIYIAIARDSHSFRAEGCEISAALRASRDRHTASATPSHTASAPPTHTASATPSHTASATPRGWRTTVQREEQRR